MNTRATFGSVEEMPRMIDVRWDRVTDLTF